MSSQSEETKPTAKAAPKTVRIAREVWERARELAALGEKVESGAMVPRGELETATAALEAAQAQVQKLTAELDAARQQARHAQTLHQAAPHLLQAPQSAPQPYSQPHTLPSAQPAPQRPQAGQQQTWPQRAQGMPNTDQMLAYVQALRHLRPGQPR